MSSGRRPSTRRHGAPTSWCFGSGTVWNDLLAGGLVDELSVMVGAKVLGGGTPAFGSANVPAMRLVETLRRDGSENVLLRYAVG